MNRTPRVAAVHDLSGLGRCSLSVILPVLSVMGIQCCPLPTAVLSAHTAFPAAKSASFLDLTPEMEQGTRHWRELGMDFDAIYSGFLGSARQISVLRQFIHDSLRSDNLPAAQGVNGSRVLTPVFRLDPRLDFLTGAMPAMLRNTPAPMLQYRVQEQFCTLFRSSLDASGYYIFALRKIIV